MCSFRSRVNPLAPAIVFTLVATFTVAAGPVAAQEITGPRGCGELFGFASAPVPVAKSADGRTVLATVPMGIQRQRPPLLPRPRHRRDQHPAGQSSRRGQVAGQPCCCL